MDEYSLKPEPASPPRHAPTVPPGLAYATPIAYSEPVPVQPGNPLLTIFTRPRDTMRWILHFDPKLYVIPIVIIGAIINAITSVFEEPAASEGFALFGLVLGIPIAIGLTLVLFYLMAWLASVVGKWFGGTGTPERCRAAMAWAQPPALAVSLLMLPITIVLTQTLNLSAAAPGRGNVPALIAILITGGIVLLGNLWSIVLYCINIGIAHRFSAWLGLAVLAVQAVIIVAALLAIVIPIAFLAG